MTAGLHGHVESLSDLAADLRECGAVLDAQRNADVFTYVEVLIAGLGIPPSVTRIVGHSPYSITGMDSHDDDDGGYQTVAIIRECNQRGRR